MRNDASIYAFRFGVRYCNMRIADSIHNITISINVTVTEFTNLERRMYFADYSN